MARKAGVPEPIIHKMAEKLSNLEPQKKKRGLKHVIKKKVIKGRITRRPAEQPKDATVKGEGSLKEDKSTHQKL